MEICGFWKMQCFQNLFALDTHFSEVLLCRFWSDVLLSYVCRPTLLFTYGFLRQDPEGAGGGLGLDACLAAPFSRGVGTVPA